jgi:hypothetical protein
MHIQIVAMLIHVNSLRVISLPKIKIKQKLGPLELGNLSFHAKFQLKRTNSVRVVAILSLFAYMTHTLSLCLHPVCVLIPLLKKVKKVPNERKTWRCEE